MGVIDTGHHNQLIHGKTLVEAIKPTIEEERRYYGSQHRIPMPTDEQIALVCSALRMHYIMLHAGSYDRSELGGEKVTDFYPVESSIGRFLRDASQVTLDEWRFKDDR